MNLRVIALAHTDFEVFAELMRQVPGLRVSVVRLQHHPRWLSHRAVGRNFFWWVLQLGSVVPHLIGGRTIIFGTALVRMFWPLIWWRSRVVWVVNELPDLSPGNRRPLRIYDRFWMKRVSPLFVSSPERGAYVSEVLNREVDGLIPNVPHLQSQGDKGAQEGRRAGVMYAGIITPRRFPREVMQRLSELALQIDFFGTATSDFAWEAHHGLRHLGSRSPDEIQSLYSSYQYGLLSYPTSDVNNDLCAPIKVYEYVFHGCACLSVNRNRGLDRWFRRYPALFVLLENWSTGFSEEEVSLQREQFMTAVEHEVRESAGEILHALDLGNLVSTPKIGNCP